jgi:alkylhydroperoxidase family enzyme
MPYWVIHVDTWEQAAAGTTYFGSAITNLHKTVYKLVSLRISIKNLSCHHHGKNLKKN